MVKIRVSPPLKHNFWFKNEIYMDNAAKFYLGDFDLF